MNSTRCLIWLALTLFPRICFCQTWPSEFFPYPSDFPSLPDPRVEISGNGHFANSPLIATYTDADGDQIQYLFNEYTNSSVNGHSSESTTFRMEKRYSKINTPNEGIVVQSVSGFQEIVKTINVSGGPTGYQGVFVGDYLKSVDIRFFSYTLGQTSGGNVVANGITSIEKRGDQSQTVTADSLKLFCNSYSMRRPTALIPTIPFKEEQIYADYQANQNDWKLSRVLFKRLLSTGESWDAVEYDADDWPNSSGQGSEYIDDFACTLENPHFWTDFINPPSVSWYGLNAFSFFPWSCEPWF